MRAIEANDIYNITYVYELTLIVQQLKDLSSVSILFKDVEEAKIVFEQALVGMERTLGT